ncbi:NAD(P)H-dependent oxidoreductase [Neobacillus pocheonensis]|uniref:NADPH-dependent FMN reductase n=1 Tax=Neobacillus pocheonensis TaxID=363869 RepID=UPI003D27D61C
MSTQKAHIVGFCGSLRKASYNKILLDHAVNMIPSEIQYTFADISGIPNYNEDLEVNPPETVIQLANLVRSGDGFIIATPEFNSSIPGALKNALDWLSRPVVGYPSAYKPVAIMGASMGRLGTVRAQSHLRDILLKINMDPINRPEVLIPQVHLTIDENGQLTDEMTLSFVKSLISNLLAVVDNKKFSKVMK